MMERFKFSNSAPTRRWRATKAFTLVELMVASSIFTVMVALVMGMVVFQSQYGVTVQHYVDMNEASKHAVTQFEQDMRLVKSVDSASNSTVVKVTILSVPSFTDVVGDTRSTKLVSYSYDRAAGTFSRQEGTTTTVLLRDLVGCELLYFSPDDSILRPSGDPAVIDSVKVKKVILAAKMRKTIAGPLGRANTDFIVSSAVTMRCRDNN